jgi:hypothetical protein
MCVYTNVIINSIMTLIIMTLSITTEIVMAFSIIMVWDTGI